MRVFRVSCWSLPVVLFVLALWFLVSLSRTISSRDARFFEDSQLFEFNAGTSDAEFLFGSEVVDYLAEIRKRSLDMRLHQKLYEPLPVGDERSRHVQAHHDHLVWLADQLTAMSKTFRPYLGFSHVK